MTRSVQRLKNLSLVALFAALLAVNGMFMIPTSPPITLQTLIVMLSGTLLGPYWGMISMLLFICLAVTGLPVLAGGGGGLAALFGPTGGYIWSWPFAAFLIGLIIRYFSNNLQRIWVIFLANFLGGFLLVHLIGLPWFLLSADLSLQKSFVLLILPFLPGDIGKVVLTGFLTIALSKALPKESLPVCKN